MFHFRQRLIEKTLSKVIVLDITFESVTKALSIDINIFFRKKNLYLCFFL
jgi:hypothetical protein